MHDRLNGDKALIEKLKPTYQPWCRRLTPDDKYLGALQADNAMFCDTKIEAITEDGIRQEDGTFHKYDIIVFATGFANSRVPPWTMKGRNGILLSDRWKEHVDGYISVCAPDMPNYFSIGLRAQFPNRKWSCPFGYGFRCGLHPAMGSQDIFGGHQVRFTKHSSLSNSSSTISNNVTDR